MNTPTQIMLTAACAALAACAGLPSADPPGMPPSDLLAKGAARMNSDELTKTLSGATISGRSHTFPGFIDMSLFANGSVSGNATLLSGTRGVAGKWSISQDGRFCYQVSVGGYPGQACEDWYRFGADYYSAVGPQLALKREVIRP